MSVSNVSSGSLNELELDCNTLVLYNAQRITVNTSGAFVNKQVQMRTCKVGDYAFVSLSQFNAVADANGSCVLPALPVSLRPRSVAIFENTICGYSNAVRRLRCTIGTDGVITLVPLAEGSSNPQPWVAGASGNGWYGVDIHYFCAPVSLGETAPTEESPLPTP